MKAVLIPRFGPATEVAETADIADPPPPGPGEVLLDILAAPINPSDFLAFQGRFGTEPPALPAVAGGEAVAQVARVGAGVGHLRTGDLVLALHAGRGNWRQRRVAPAEPMRALPSGADPLQLAMLTVNPVTAYQMLTEFGPMRPGSWVIQNAGNSAVGIHVARLARHMGSRIISLVRRPDQIDPVRAAGGDIVLVDGPDLTARVLSETGGDRPGLAIDAVAGEASGRLAACLRPGGTLVVYGLLSGQDCAVPPHDIVFRDIRVRGYWFTAWFEKASPQERAARYDSLARMVIDGTLHTPVEACYSLNRVQAALAHAARSRQGKILLLPNPRLPRGVRPA